MNLPKGYEHMDPQSKAQALLSAITAENKHLKETAERAEAKADNNRKFFEKELAALNARLENLAGDFVTQEDFHENIYPHIESKIKAAASGGFFKVLFGSIGKWLHRKRTK